MACQVHIQVEEVEYCLEEYHQKVALKEGTKEGVGYQIFNRVQDGDKDLHQPYNKRGPPYSAKNMSTGWNVPPTKRGSPQCRIPTRLYIVQFSSPIQYVGLTAIMLLLNSI